MTTTAINQDPYLLPVPGPEALVIPEHLIVGTSARANARFGDDHWPLDLLTANPTARAASVNWSGCPEHLAAELRLAAWTLINGQLRPTFVKHKTEKRRRMRSRVGVAQLQNTMRVWMDLAAWLAERQVMSLTECDSDALDAYARHVVDDGANRRKTMEVLTALTRLWAFDQLSASPSGVGKPRWEDVGVDDYLPPETSGGGENSTEPLDETTMGPLLVWAMRVVDDFADDILSARDEHQRLVQAAEASVGNPAGRAALEAYLGPLVDAGVPLPSLEHRGAVRIARTYIAGSTGASGSQVDEFMTRYGGAARIPPTVGGRCPLAVPITGRIGRRPWRDGIDFGEATTATRHLATAAAIVIMYLTGMRPQEVLSLRTGCCPDPEPRPGGAQHHLIRGHHYKTAKDGDGNHLSSGVERDVPWVAITPVVNAIRVLERMVPDGALLFDLNAHGHPNKRSPARGAIKCDTMNGRIEGFVAWANALAAAHGLDNQAIPPDRHGKIGTKRFRRTLAWHIARRPGGLVALAIQYGHLRTAVSGAYANRSRSGIDELLDVETVRVVADTVADLSEQLDAGGGVSGPAARHAIKTATSGPFFAGVVISATTARRLAANEDVMLYENPNALLLCRFRREQALCQRDGADH